MQHALLLLLSLTLAGCHVMRPVSSPIGTRYRAAAEQPRSGCLLVLLPGIGDSIDSFRRGGFLSEVERERVGCDLALVDAHFGYYVTQNVVERVAVDVLRRARADGYDNVWLVGISMGGYGAMLTARRHPELVDGVVLIAPLFGVPPRESAVTEEVLAAGGLHRWAGLDEARVSPVHHFREPRLVWDWLRDTSLDVERPGRVVLAYGLEDSRASSYHLAADALPAEAVFRAEGAHDWPTWRGLWARVLDAAPWCASLTPRGRGAPSPCR